MHTSADLLEKWIYYGTLDAEVTFFLREILIDELSMYKVEFEDLKTVWELYVKYWLPFGEILTDIERAGIRVNKSHLVKAQEKAEADLELMKTRFTEWIRKNQPDLYEFNPSSTQQLQQLLYAPFKRVSIKKNFATNTIYIDRRDFSGNDFGDDVVEDYGEDFEAAERKPRKNDVMDYFPEEREFKVENVRGIIEEGRKTPLKFRTMTIKGLGITPTNFSASGLPSVDINALKNLAGSPPDGKFGAAYDHFV